MVSWSGRASLATGVVSLMLCCGSCGLSAGTLQTGEAAASLGEAPAALPQRDGPLTDGSQLNGVSLAIELRDAAVGALRVPDPQIAVESVERSNGADEIRLSVDNPWETIEVQATAEDKDATSVTVFATPVRTEWALGDGSTLICVQDIEAPPADNENAERSCSHSYADDGVYEGTGSITWGLSWSVDDQYRGVFSTVASTASFVVEQQ